MSEIYILDEIPILGSPPTAQEEICLVIPSLKRYLFARDYGSTIYGTDSQPCWTISVDAYKGKSTYEHWMNALPIGFLPRVFTLILMKWLYTKKVAAHGWRGKAVIVSGKNMSELHFLVYSDALDISLDLHLALNECSRASMEKGIGYLEELTPHRTDS